MLARVPELAGAPSGFIRIPHEVDVGVTQRVQAILDTSPFQRLKRISQLGLVSQVYPGATHSRFEHSLGVYQLACRVLTSLLHSSESFASQLTDQDAALFLLSALLHDIGHWPYCHPIEDLHLDWIPDHEVEARSLIQGEELAPIIESHWNLPPTEVADFLCKPAKGHFARQILQNVLNGPVDVDKMDYLQRDSLHAGVPYGRNFDVPRLIQSLCIGPDGKRLAITEKGKTAAEMMVFARYVMFSEVYWHHAVRSATAMLQRLVFDLYDGDLPGSQTVSGWVAATDVSFASLLHAKSKGSRHHEKLANSLFGTQRRFYKRFSQYNFSDSPEIHAALAGRPYRQLAWAAGQLAESFSADLGSTIDATEVLIDAPPPKREVQFKLDVQTKSADRKSERFVALDDISPVVRALATEQFDNYVKRVRVYVAADRSAQLAPLQKRLTERLLNIAQRIDSAAPECH